LYVENAPAKLNLGLQILGKRPDGFHDLVSIFQSISLCDRLTFGEGEKGQMEFSCDDPDLPKGPDNLVCRAVDLFRKVTGTARGVRIHLEKRIPHGAGLGGGSSDAAAVLTALNQLWAGGLTLKELQEIGLELGSDVPFFMRRGTALVRGRGERLRYIPWRTNPIYLLVSPVFRISTAWAFANYKKPLTEKGGYATFLNSVNPDELSISELFRHLQNDFLPLVLQTYPEAVDILDHLQNSGALAASMSGSGSTMFGVYEDQLKADHALAGLQKKGHRAFLCYPLLS
jgi:4-diphosphocytidyl-2-C-methyl-D-erythritol kinase